jgi:hypothetical protein
MSKELKAPKPLENIQISRRPIYEIQGPLLPSPEKAAQRVAKKNEGVGEHVRIEISPGHLPRQTAGKLRGHPPQRTKSS